MDNMIDAQWIPVSERTPEDTECGIGDVLVVVRYGLEPPIVCCGYMFCGIWWTYAECGMVGADPLGTGDTVTHWMPLPEPPESI